MSPFEWTIVVAVAVAAVAYLMKAFGTKEPDAVEKLLEEVSETSGDLSALTSDGVAFMRRGDGIVMVPVGRPGDPELAFLGEREPRHGHAHGAADSLIPGELIAARIRRGAPDHDPWRLEALGRDREYRTWRFETEEAARAALEMVEERIVRPPLDEDGEPVRIGDADFDEARRIEEETERDLASGAAFDEEIDDRER
jgi:hypothetical protein